MLLHKALQQMCLADGIGRRSKSNIQMIHNAHQSLKQCKICVYVMILSIPDHSQKARKMVNACKMCACMCSIFMSVHISYISMY